MKIVITGGGGFLGQQLARRILALGSLPGPDGQPRTVDCLTLFDLAFPPQGVSDSRVEQVTGEIADRDTVARLIDRRDIGVFHLASVVSGGGEKDFDLAMRVNLHGALHVLEALRAQGSTPRIVSSSSVAAFGGDEMPPRVSDLTKQTPLTTYGVTKSIGELLINDYTRKGFVDGRSARLPTVIVRPGKPNAAASSFASGVIREPLAGVECLLPVPLETVMPVAGHRTVAEGMIKLYSAESAALGPDRAFNLPSLQVSVAQMIESLKRVAGDRKLGPIRVERDPLVERIVAGWPTATDASRALKLGLPVDTDVDGIIRAYIEDFLDR